MEASKSIETLGPASGATQVITPSSPDGDRLDRGGISWAVFEGGRNPYVVLIIIYIFMPYVSASLVGDPVRGQELISRFSQYSGWIVMATAPLLGASIDRVGRRKPGLALIVVLMVPLIASLWWTAPRGAGLSLTTTMWITLCCAVLFAWSEVLHNSLLIRAAGLRGAHAASGLALSLGNAASVLALGFTAWAFALPGRVTWWWVPAQPLFGLDPAMHEPERVVALLAAALLAIGAVPLFLFTPDMAPGGVPFRRALMSGARDIVRMIATVRRHRDAAVFLGARMFFYDGMNGVLFFFGVLAAGVMKWGPLDLLITGIILSMVGVGGGMIGRWLDEHVGPRNALRIEIAMTIGGLVALLGMAPDRILYLWRYDVIHQAPLWDGPVYRTWPALIYLLIGFNNAIFITAQYASSRTALTRLFPARPEWRLLRRLRPFRRRHRVAGAGVGEHRHARDAQPAGRLRVHHRAPRHRPDRPGLREGGAPGHRASVIARRDNGRGNASAAGAADRQSSGRFEQRACPARRRVDRPRDETTKPQKMAAADYICGNRAPATAGTPVVAFTRPLPLVLRRPVPDAAATPAGGVFETALTALARRLRPQATGMVSLRRLSGGATQEIWRFELDAPAGGERLILRRSPRGDRAGEVAVGLAVEARLLAAANATGVPVPAVRHVLEPGDGLGHGYVMDCIEGETLGGRIVRSEGLAAARPMLARQCGTILAAIHHIDPADFASLDRLSPADLVDQWRAAYRRADWPRPVFDLAFRWLADRCPSPPATPVLVHGDFRNGNLMIGPEGLRAVLDWELAHIGDPHEDLAWICVN